MRAWLGRHRRTTVALMVAAVALGAFVAVQVAMSGRISSGVSVGGLDLSGQSPARAAETLEHELWPRISNVRLETGDSESVSVSAESLGVRLDVQATAAAALASGRHRLFGILIWLPGGGGEVEPILAIDGDALERGLEPLREKLDKPARDASLLIREGWGIIIVPSRDGRTLDAAGLARAVAAAARSGSAYDGPLPISAVPATVSTATARARATTATVYFGRPITLRRASHTVRLSPVAIARMVSVNTGADAAEHPLTFRNDKAPAMLRKLLAWAERPAVDADIVVHREGGITVTQSKDGEALDIDDLLEDLDAAAVSKGLRTVLVSTSAVLPQLTSDDVRTKGLAALGSQFTTYFDPKNEARARNITLAAKLVDGAVVQPGEVFSLNSVMGPRTVNRGFDYAPVIAADNVLRQGVGGGICQYATTLFNAALLAGLPIVERHAHSLFISHYPIGRDATVAWGSLDLRFRNDTPTKLVIRSWVQNGALSTVIVGKTGRTVTIQTGAFYDVSRPTHNQSDPRVVYDSDLGPGVVRWETGVDGRSIRIERTVRDGEGAVVLRDSFVSRYQPLDWVKRVGTT